jgi:hypothetical protein
LRAALADDSWPGREGHLCAAYEAVARMHNAMGIFARLDGRTMSFHQRPYRVLEAGRFAKAVSDEIRDPQLRKIYESVGPIGSIDQFADSTILLMRSDLRTRLCALTYAPVFECYSKGPVEAFCKPAGQTPRGVRSRTDI